MKELYTVTVGNTGRERLTEDFHYRGVTVPKGFEFDGASAPRLFWSIIPPFKMTKKAACVHDYLCKEAEGPEDRLAADECFFRMLREAGLSLIRCYLGYIGVRIGAWWGSGVNYKHWRKGDGKVRKKYFREYK